MSKTSAQPYIDVIGEASYDVTASEYKITFSLKYKTGLSKMEKSGAVLKSETRKALNAVITALIENGIPEDHIKFGGTVDLRTWRKKGHDEYRYNRIVVRSHDANQVIQIPIWLDGADIGKHQIEYSQFQPIYDPDSALRVEAFGRAMDNAAAVAGSIATAAGRELGDAVEVQDRELSDDHNSGGRMMMRGGAVMAAGGADIGDVDFEDYVQTHIVKLQVRFDLK